VKYSPDILHNNKGFIKKIENVLKENGKIKKTLLKKTMGYVLKRNNIGLLDGKKWMEFTLKFEDILFQK